MSDMTGFDMTGRGDRPLDGLMRDLVADLSPTKPLASPWMRASLWLGVVAVVAIALASLANLPAIQHRLMAVPDMWLAVFGSTLTAGLATIAAFQLSVPDRSPVWGLLPLPGLILWIGASGMGCARTWLIPGTHDASLAETKECMTFIVGLSIPLSIVLFAMLRRGYSLYPSLTGALAGLAAAAAAATLLNFFHPFDAAITDLLVHTVAVLLVVLANRLFGGAILGRGRHVPRGPP